MKCGAPHRGFTLIELVACLLVVALLATMAVVSLAGVEKIHRLDDAIDQLRTLDERARSGAVRFNRAAVVRFEMDQDAVTYQPAGQKREEASIAAMPGGIDLAGVRVQDQDWADRQVAVSYTAAGDSPTFAVRWTLGESEATSACVVVAGLTGRITRVRSQEQADEMLDIVGTIE